MPDDKRCAECGHCFPLTSDYWHKSKDGFHAKCRRCRNKLAKDRRKKKTEQKLNEIERGAVDLFIRAARLGGSTVPHSSELVEVLYTYFGGVAGFGNAWMKQFYDSPAGGAFRTKMLETMVRLTANNTAMGGAKKPLTLWSEEELEQELQKRVIEAATVINAIPYRGPDAPTEPTGCDPSTAPIAEILPSILPGNDKAGGSVDHPGGGHDPDGTP